MVYYFTSNRVDPPVTIYMGKDKVENEELIKHGWPNDVWFHVDKLSSAHVYLRMPESMTWETIPEGVLEDCAQLTKANSIEGNKKDNISVIYTPHGNLLKNASMNVGTVSFHNQRTVRRVHVAARENAVINRLAKTRTERTDPDLAREKLAMERNLRKAESDAQRKRDAALKLSEKERAEAAALRNYEGVFDERHMQSNREASERVKGYEELEDDFM